MTTKKDPGTSENINPNKIAAEDCKSHQELTERHPGEGKGVAKTEVKNAHAAGDGAMGPNETPLPDVEMNNSQGKNQYENPPY